MLTKLRIKINSDTNEDNIYKKIFSLKMSCVKKHTDLPETVYTYANIKRFAMQSEPLRLN